MRTTNGELSYPARVDSEEEVPDNKNHPKRPPSPSRRPREGGDIFEKGGKQPPKAPPPPKSVDKPPKTDGKA